MAYFGTLAPASNRATYKELAQFKYSTNGTLVPQAILEAMTFVFVVAENGSAVLTATTGNGKITVISDGIIQIIFERDEVTGIEAKEYDAGLTAQDTDGTEQIFSGTQPFYDGVVPV